VLKKDEEPVSYGEVWCARKDEKYQQGRPFAKFGDAKCHDLKIYG
jgi:hypothetical protein